jgi:hypothetical protein
VFAVQKRIQNSNNESKNFMIDVITYIQNLKNPQKEVCENLRKIILDTFPNIKEAMKWGVPAFNDGMFYFVALKDHVNLGFSIKGLEKEELALFDGGGKTTRHIEIKSLDTLDKKRIVALLNLVEKRQK